MKLNKLWVGVVLAGCAGVGAWIITTSSQPVAQAEQPQASSPQVVAQASPGSTDITGLTIPQKMDLLKQNKGKFGSGDALRRFFFGDLKPLAVQPGGAGMVVNLYNAANDTTFSYCATYDVIVAQKSGQVPQFAPNEVK
jgi:hypothetical protein